MKSRGLRMVTGGTDNHLLLVDLTPVGEVTGHDAEVALDGVGITVNKNAIPFDTRSHNVTSGIRVGSAAATTRGFTEAECERIGELIGDIVTHLGDEAVAAATTAEVKGLLAAHPLYPELG
jgi:glycine hydroxymethyltransferase